MNGLQPFESTIEQTTAAVMKTSRITGLRELSFMRLLARGELMMMMRAEFEFLRLRTKTAENKSFK